MEQTKKNKRSKRTIILTVVMMAAVFLFWFTSINGLTPISRCTRSLTSMPSRLCRQRPQVRLEPENLRVTPSGKVTFDIDEAGKLVRPLQFDLHGISGENVQTATLLLVSRGYISTAIKRKSCRRNDAELPVYAQVSI